MKKLLMFSAVIALYGTSAYGMECDNGSDAYPFKCSLKVNGKVIEELEVKKLSKEKMTTVPHLSKGDEVEVCVNAIGLQNATYPQKAWKSVVFSPIQDVK